MLINLPIKSDETYVSTLVELMDYMAEHPDEYLELINECRSETQTTSLSAEDLFDIACLCHAS